MTSGESSPGLSQGIEGLGGTAGVSSRWTTVLAEGGSCWHGAWGRQGAKSSQKQGRLEEVVGPELGTVPDTRACASPQPSALPSEATSQGPGPSSLHCWCSLSPGYLWPGRGENQGLSRRVEPKRRCSYLSFWNWICFPCVHVGVARNSHYSTLPSLNCWLGVSLPSRLTAGSQGIPELSTVVWWLHPHWLL